MLRRIIFKKNRDLLESAAFYWSRVKVLNTFSRRKIGSLRSVENKNEIKMFKEIPGPTLNEQLRWAVNHSFQNPREKLTECRRRYGNIFRFSFGPFHVVHLFNPSDVATLLRNEGKYPNRGGLPLLNVLHRRMDTNADSLAERRGQHWWDLRRKLQQVMLNPASGANFLYVQDRVVEDFLDHLEAVKDKDGYVENIQTELFSLSLEVLGEICYGTRLNSFQNGIPEVRSALKTTFDCLNESLRGIPTFLLFRTPMYQRFEDATKTLQTFYTQNFESCLQRSKESSEFKNIIPNLLLNHKNISLKELCSTISSLFTAGTESTTNTLSFALYHLASHPEKQEKLWHEINRFVPEFPTAKQSELVKPPYLTACVKESFRMVYPTLAGPHRILDRDINISGYCIPKGVHVVCQNALMCRMEEYFENADDYVPERWLRRHNPPSAKFSHGETVDMRPFVVLPFGHGLRSCIGRRFAEQQIYLVIAKMLQRYKLVYDGEEILVKEKIFTAPDRPIRLKLVPR